MEKDRIDLPVLVVDGANFVDFDGFAREFSMVLCHYTWRGNLDAFNDILRGGFGTPEGGWVLQWQNSELSKAALGYEATIRRLEQILVTCHPSNRSVVRDRIATARRGEGPTLFDEIVEIIREQGAGGEESEDGSCWNWRNRLRPRMGATRGRSVHRRSRVPHRVAPHR